MWFFYVISVDIITIVMYIMSIETQKKGVGHTKKDGIYYDINIRRL